MKNKKLFAILTLVCFMFTLMPVAAFAATFDEQSSTVGLADSNINEGDTVIVEVDMNATTGTLYVWFEEVDFEDVVVNAVKTVAANDASDDNFVAEDFVGCTAVGDGVITVTVTGGADYVEFPVQIDRASDFVVHAGTVNPVGAADWKDVAAKELRAAKVIEVAVDPAKEETDEYALKIVTGAGIATVTEATADRNGYIEDKEVVTVNFGEANGIDSAKLQFALVNPDRNASGAITGDGVKVNAADIKVDTTSGIEVEVDASRSGKVELEVTPMKLGTHKVYVTIGDYKATIKVEANVGEAETIETYYVSKTPVNIDAATTYPAAALNGGLHSSIVFKIYDEKGNEMLTSTNGFGKAANTAPGAAEKNYVAIVDQPAGSKLKNEDLYLTRTMSKVTADGWTIKTTKAIEEEGTYTFKVALDNGKSATASIVVKEAGDPVALNVTYEADSVQLGDTIKQKTVVWLDKNYVATTATVGTDVEIAVSGAAVEMVYTQDSLEMVTDAQGNSVPKYPAGTIIVKDNEKYVGETIKVTFIDKENNLVATKTLVVASEEKDIVLDVTAVPVDATKTITAKLVDETGKSVALSNATAADAYVIVLDKPADSDVTAEVSAINAAKGQFTFAFSCDTVGVVEVQTVLQTNEAGVVRYYTGVQEIKVGATGIEDTVVMSIGASKIVVNDEVVAIDAAPMIKDSRTFVPFRALAEAFGATVEFDAATQAVVAELDGTKVVMTIGANAYTVNGVAKTADVAPFISDSRTMVPVRFVAEAFGINVTPIAAEDGSVADVLFTK